jgi:hypothetical protein
MGFSPASIQETVMCNWAKTIHLRLFQNFSFWNSLTYAKIIEDMAEWIQLADDDR